MDLPWLTIELTTKCDLRCNNCFALAALESKSRISWERSREIAQEGYRAGFRRLHLTGGEPTLWKEFFPLIEYAFEIGYESLFFNTHGGHLTEDFCKKVASYGDRISLTISLNGNRELHESVRGPGSYDKAIFGIKNALLFGLSVELFVVVGKRLLKDLPGFTDRTFKDFPGIKRMTWIQLHRVEEDAYDVEKDLLTPSEFVEMVRMGALLSLYGYPIYILDNSLSNVVAKEIGLPHLPLSPNIETAGRFVVLVDGKITNSHSSREEFGIFVPGIFQNILESSFYKEKTGEDVSVCPSCEYVSLCKESYNPRPSLAYMDFSADPFCKRVLSFLSEREFAKQ